MTTDGYTYRDDAAADDDGVGDAYEEEGAVDTPCSRRHRRALDPFRRRRLAMPEPSAVDT